MHPNIALLFLSSCFSSRRDLKQMWRMCLRHAGLPEETHDSLQGLREILINPMSLCSDSETCFLGERDGMRTTDAFCTSV